MLIVISSLSAFSQQSLWVCQSYRFDVTSSVMGMTYNMSWSTNGGYLSLSGAGFYRDITVTQYFSGTAYVTCEWDYKLTSSSRLTHVKRQIAITCRDNQVSISPTSMTMSPGESRYVSYRHQYDNQYTSAANAYFQSSDPSICTVSSSGEVVAKSPGTTYINVYSKVSSVSPYCKVTVKQVDPTSVSIPSSITMTAGETRTLTPTIYPSNAQTSYSWTSSDTQIATVSSSGTITAKKHGNATITVKTANGLSASCKVTINKAKLSISASHSSGVLFKGTEITLSASAPNSVIHYTLNGDNPNYNSKIYSDPIIISDHTVLKAYATNKDFIDSDIITLSYDITDIAAEYTIPQDNSNISWNNFAFTIVFNQNIAKSKKFDNITIYDSEGNEVQSSKSIIYNTLSVIPINGFKYGTYKISIPSDAIKSTNNQFPNLALNHSFNNSEPSNGIIAFDANGVHSYIVKADGSLWAFGNNSHGELGDGTKTDRLTPVKIMDDVKRPIAGWCFGLAIKNDNSLWSWGWNVDGELGDGTKTQRSTPKKIKENIVFAEANGWSRAHAIDVNGNLWAWGDNEYGNLGDGTTIDRYSPVKLAIDNVTFTSGGPHSAAITANNDLYMWGNNSYGGLGDGTTTYRKTPIKVKNGIKDVILPYCATIVLDTNGEVWSWGNNRYSQLGTGNQIDYDKPQKILENITKLCEWEYGGFAINNNHELYAWGELDFLHWTTLGTFVQSPTVIMENVKDVKCAYNHALIMKTDGSLWGVGSNGSGQLGCLTEGSVVNEPILLFPGQSPQIESAVPIHQYITMEVGDIAYPSFTILPQNASISDIEWTCSNECVNINENGFIEAIKAGNSLISCKITDSFNISKEFTIEVTIKKKGASVISIFADDHVIPVEYYNINGTKVSPKYLVPGVYILRKGDKTEKVVIR